MHLTVCVFRLSCPTQPKPASCPRSPFGLRPDRLQHISDVRPGAPMMRRVLPPSAGKPHVKSASSHRRVGCITVTQQAACCAEAQLCHLTAVAAGPTNCLEAHSAARHGAGLILKSELAFFLALWPCRSCWPGHYYSTGDLRLTLVTCRCFWNWSQFQRLGAASSFDSETSELLLALHDPTMDEFGLRRGSS